MTSVDAVVFSDLKTACRRTEVGCGTHRQLAGGRDKQSRDIKDQPIALRRVLTEKSGEGRGSTLLTPSPPHCTSHMYQLNF